MQNAGEKLKIQLEPGREKRVAGSMDWLEHEYQKHQQYARVHPTGRMMNRR